MTISNSPYEFDQFSRNIFVIFVEKYLSLRKKNNEKDTELIINKLEPKLKVEKRKITLNYFEKLISNNSSEIENFKQFLKQSGFGEKTSANFHKVLIDNGFSHIINLCNKKEEKGFNVYLDNLCQFADIQYSVKYMDILLNFLSKNFDVSSNGKNSDMYNQLINKTQSICFMCNEIKMNPYFNLENHITRIINVLNSENIKLLNPRSGFYEQDPESWFIATIKCFNKIRRDKPKEFSAVRALGISGQMHGATLIDKNNQVLHPCILWNDTRSTKQCLSMEEKYPSLREESGNIAMPGFTAPKILWIKALLPVADSAKTKNHIFRLESNFLRFPTLPRSYLIHKN